MMKTHHPHSHAHHSSYAGRESVQHDDDERNPYVATDERNPYAPENYVYADVHGYRSADPSVVGVHHNYAIPEPRPYRFHHLATTSGENLVGDGVHGQVDRRIYSLHYNVTRMEDELQNEQIKPPGSRPALAKKRRRSARAPGF